MNKITSFEAALIKNYISLLEAKYPKLNMLENNIDKNKLDLFKAAFINTVNNFANEASHERIKQEKMYDITSENDEEMLFDKYCNYHKELKVIEAIQGACIYALATQDKIYEHFINEILETDINTTASKVKSHSSFSDETMYLYYKYLKERVSNPNFDEIMMFVFEDHDWLSNLDNYKGYTTINDLLRDVLSEICYDHNNSEFITDKCTKELDLYFTTKKHDFYLQERFPQVLDQKTIEAYKKYQLKLMMADAYTFLKYASIKESEYPLCEEEVEILEELEKAFSTQNFKVFTNFEKRRFLYNEFWVNINDNYINVRRNPIRYLIQIDEAKTLKKANPIYFLE